MSDAPTFPNSRRNSPQAGRAGWSTTPLICSGGIATSASLPQIERKQVLLDLLGENDVELPGAVLRTSHRRRPGDV